MKELRDISDLTIQLLRRNVKRFRGGLVSDPHGFLCHSTLGLGGITKTIGDGEGVPLLAAAAMKANASDTS